MLITHVLSVVVVEFLAAINHFYNFRSMITSINITYYPEDLYWSYIHGKSIRISFHMVIVLLNDLMSMYDPCQLSMYCAA